MNVNTNFILYYCITFCTIKERDKSNRTYIIINYHTFVSMAVLIRTRDHFKNALFRITRVSTDCTTTSNMNPFCFQCHGCDHNDGALSCEINKTPRLTEQEEKETMTFRNYGRRRNASQGMI